MTYGLVRNILAMMLRRVIIGTVGEPVGGITNLGSQYGAIQTGHVVSVWEGGGDRKAGHRNCWTTVRSMIRVKTGVMEIGQ